MTNKFALFLFLIWLPGWIAAIGFFAENFAADLQNMSGVKLALVQYAALLLGMAPILYVAFSPKKKPLGQDQ